MASNNLYWVSEYERLSGKSRHDFTVLSDDGWETSKGVWGGGSSAGCVRAGQ